MEVRSALILFVLLVLGMAGLLTARTVLLADGIVIVLRL
jgi:hypothetical protein